MNNYVIKKDFIELKELYENDKINLFEERLSCYTVQEIIDFSHYFAINIKNKDEYYNVKVIAEIFYVLITKNSYYCADEIIEYSKRVIGRCIVLSAKKQLWNDVKKYTTFMLKYVTDKEEIYELKDYLGLAYFYLGDYLKELEIRKDLLDYNYYMSLYNYALALFHNKQYEEARVYYKNCLEKCEFPPALRNQAQISIILEDNYLEAYSLVKKATDIYRKNPAKFDIISIDVYVEHQFFLCGVCSREKLLEELLIHKKNCENEINNNNEVEKNEQNIRFINLCYNLNRAIFFFEEMNYDKSFEHLKIIVDDEESKILLLNTNSIFEDNIKKIAKLYVLLIKILKSFNLVFSDTIEEINLDSKIRKIDILRSEIQNSEKNDFIYEYYKVISLFLKYVNVILIYLFREESSEVIKLYEYIQGLRVKKSNYLLLTFIQCLYKLSDIFKEYKNDAKDCYFIDDLRAKSVSGIKNVCNEFSGKVRGIATSVSSLENHTICSDDNFCRLVIKAILHIKNNVPSYVRKYKLKETTNLHEEDFRDTLGVFFSSIYKVDSEAKKKEGRTDLIVNTQYDSRVVEFKIWGRNDYKEVVGQIIERYLTEFDNSGYIFMINSQKCNIKDKYLENVKNEKFGYVLNSIQVKYIDKFEYFVTEHETKFNVYKIYHFIYNIYD